MQEATNTTISLFELNEHLRRVVALNFASAIWIHAEIAAHQTSRGHHFLSLVEKGVESDYIIAQADAVIWSRTFSQLRLEHGRDIITVLKSGLATRLKVQLDFHERFGLKLIVEDIDLSYAIGQLELKRRATIEALQAEGAFNKNAQLPLPSVLQRIAVLSSEQAAGWQDFKQQLLQNSYKYHFQLHLFPTSMQGDQVTKEIKRQLRTIENSSVPFDAIVIVRGGGARLDLTAFDELELCRAVANAPIPVLSGIGHDADETILDKVAHHALKTPTAVADFLVQHNFFFEAQMEQTFHTIRSIVYQQLYQAQLRLERMEQQLKWQRQQLIHQAEQQLHNLAAQLPKLTQTKLQQAHKQLDHLEAITQLLSLENTLKRGFSIVQQDEKVITSVDEIKNGTIITIVLQDGTVQTQMI